MYCTHRASPRAMSAAASAAAASAGGDASGEVREQDRFLPIANIARIMKRALPPSAKMSQDSKQTVQVRLPPASRGSAPSHSRFAAALSELPLIYSPHTHARTTGVLLGVHQLCHVGGSGSLCEGEAKNCERR